jgi:hypothetical protein
MNSRIKNPPNNIFLQTGLLKNDFEAEFKDLVEVTWCAERIYDTDLKFQINQTENRLFTKEDMIAFVLYASDFSSILDRKEYLEKGFETWALHRK